MGTLKNYANSTAVETALDKGIQGYDKAVKNETDILSLREDLGELNHEYEEGYRDLFWDTVGNLNPDDKYRSVLLPVIAGQKVKISGEGIANGAVMLWGTADINGVIIRKSGETTIATDLEITIAEGECYFITNSLTGKNHYCKTISSVVELSQYFTENTAKSINNLEKTKVEKTFVNQLQKCEKWWETGDEVFESLSDEKRMAFMKITKFKVKTYTPNTTANLYGCSINSDGSYSLKVKWDSLEGTQTFPVTLPVSDTYTTLTVSSINKKCKIDITITYTTNGNAPQVLTTDTEKIYVNVDYDGESFENGNFDNRIIEKIYKSDDVSAITLIRTQNVNTAITGSTYWYYAQYLIVFNDGTSKTVTKSATTAQTGILEENLDNFAVVFINADVIAEYRDHLMAAKAELDLVKATHYSRNSEIGSSVSRIENNLLSDGIDNLPECQIFKNGTAGDYYGQDNVRYRFKVGSGRKNIHVFFEYQWTAPPVYKDNSTYYTLAKVYGGLVKVVQYYRDINAGSLRRNIIFGTDNERYGSQTASINVDNHIIPNGNMAFWIQYTGETASSSSDVTCSFSNGTVTVAHSSTGTVIGSISYQPTDSVDTLINLLNTIEGISCGAVETTGHICSELLISEEDVTFNLWKTYTNSNNETKYDYPKIDIYYAHDKNWHTCEIIVDIENEVSYVAFDGQTVRAYINLNATESQYIEIGGAYGDTETPIRVRNLEIDYGSFGDAEIVQSKTPPYTGVLAQLISKHNPRLLIYEGHGVDIGVDVNAPYSDDMAVTTDRLNRVFTALREKGYVPVTWQQIIDWKLSGGKLPKRCFNIMMDDWRFENYVDYDKRRPFEKFNVKPGLAVVSSTKALSDTMEINGKEYAVADIVRMTMTAGWYPCSHTTNHRRNTDVAPSELDELLKVDVLDCNALGIYSDIIVYPYGAFNTWIGNAVNRSSFKLGVNIVINTYNCKMTNNANFGRVEIGTRQSLDDVLAPIV